MPEDKLPIPKFAAKIKAKYPEYRDVNDTLLVQRIVEKYPEYKDSVDLSGIEEPVKKKVTGAGLSLGSKVGGLELQSIGGQAKIESGIAAGAEQGVPESKMIGGGALKVQGIPTKEQSKQNIVNKAFGRLESLSGGYKDFEDIYNYSPKEFDNLASKIAPEVKKEEINKFYTSEAARKDAYINRVLQNYKTKKTELQLESARQERPVVDENVSLALNFLSGKTGKTYQIPQTEEQVREILNDTEKVKEIFRLQSEQNVSSVKDVLELDKQWNELNEAERQLKDRLRPVIGRIAFEKLSQQNPNVSSREIGAEVLRVLDPQMYAIYKNSGGDKPSSYTVGVQRQTPVMADQLNRQMVEVGNQIKRLYGNEFAIEEADVEEQAANRKYTFDKQNQVKQKIAAILHERGLSPSKATEKLKDEVANKYLSDEDKATWFENNKIYNNVDLPDTGFGYSLKKAYQNTVQDAVSTVFGGLIPNRKQELSREILGDYSGATAELGEDPAQKQRLQFLRDKEQSAPLTEKEKLEKEDLEGYTGIRTKMEKIWDMAGAGTGQILGLGSISAFTGGLSSARAGLGALKSLIAPSGGNTAVSAAAYLMSHEQNAKESLRIFPDEKDEFKRFLNTEMTTAIDVLVERIFPEEQFLNGVGKKEVSALIANLTQKNLSRQINDNTFKQLAKRIIGGSKRLLATPLQETAEEELALVLKDTLKKTINPDYEKESIGIKELVETGEAAFWGSIFLGAPKMLFGGGANNVPLTALWDAASTEDGYLTTKMTIERLKSEGELTEQEAAERLRNLEIGRKEFENNPILSGDMGGLSESQKQNYFARLLNEKILEENAAATTDTNLQKQYETEIKESQKIREGIYKQEIKVTPENEEVKIDQDRDLMDEGVEDEFLAELQSKAGKGTQNQDLRFFIDQAANAPNQFVDTYGEEATKKLLSMATTEQLEKSMKDWARLNPDSPAVALIDEELGRREELTKPETAEKKEEEIESKIKDALAEIYRIDRTALVEGFAEFASQSQALRDAGGLNYHAHGMGKSTIASAFKDLFTLFKNGIDKSRGGGRLHTAPLGSTGMETAGATASGAYADGPFILISREANLTDINQVEAILVNDGLISIKPDLLNLLRERFPNLTIETYSNSSKAVTELNNKTKQQETKQNIPERGQATKKILTSEQTTQDANDIITGKKVFERFSPQEQRGFAEGGTSHVEASLLLAADEGTGGKDNATPEAQENRIEQYAKDKGIWDDNTTETLTQKYGEPIAAGEEAVIWGDEKKGTVIKTQDTFQYENLQQKLDGITLHNAYFPEAAIKVIGFGKNANGEFQVIVEQPHIQGEKLTPEEIKTYLESVGFKEDENGNFSNGEVIIEDVHTGNAIKDKEGNIIVIDPIMRLNTEAQGYGGKRKTSNKISPTEQPQSGIKQQETQQTIPEQAENPALRDVESTAKALDAKKADIEKRRQEELNKVNQKIEKLKQKEDRRVKTEKYRTLDINDNPVEVEITTNADGTRVLKARQINEDGSVEPMAYVTERINNKAQASLTNEKLIEGYIGNEGNTLKRTNIDENHDQTYIDKINAKYDAELSALEESEGVSGSALKDVEETAKKIVGESAFEKLKKEGYTIEKGKFDSDAYASFFGLHTGVQASEFENAGLRLVKPSEKIKVYRGKGKNVADGENEGVTWVAEDKKVAENYSGDGNVEEVEVSKPKNPFPNPTDTIHVKGSDVGNKLRLVRDRLFKEGKLTKDQALEASKAIDEFVSAAGEESELYSTKTNKKGVSTKYVKALQALGFDGIVQKESYNSGSPFTATKTGNETNTYGIFKAPTQYTEAAGGSALKDVESTAKALEGVDELKSEKGFSFVGNKKLKGEKHKGLNFDELINRLATDFFGTYGVAKSKSTIESEIDALERLLMRPDTFKYEPKKAKPFEEQLKLLESYRDKGIKNVRDMLISEAYHKAKSDGSNPELVKAVEELLGKPTEKQKTETTPTVSSEGVSGSALKDVDLVKDNGKKIISKALGENGNDASDFKNTKVVDDNGKPKQVFHGTWADAPFEDFKEGDTYFTDNYDTAKMFGSNREGGVDTENMDMQGKPFVMEVTDTKGNKHKKVIANTDMASIFSDLQYDVSPVGEWDGKDLEYFDSDSIEHHFGVSKNKVKSLKIEERKVGKNVDDFGVSKHYINIENPLIIDAKGDIWNGSKGGDIQGKINEARESGKYDGVIVKNIVEGGLGNPDTKPTTTYVVFNKKSTPKDQSLSSNTPSQAQPKADSGGVGGDVESTTPIKDKWQERVDSIDVENEYTDLNELKVGDVIITKTGTLGFVKKINPKKVIIESTYGGWGGNDIELTELSVNKSEISKFKKPKAGSGGVGEDVESKVDKMSDDEVKNAINNIGYSIIGRNLFYKKAQEIYHREVMSWKEIDALPKEQKLNVQKKFEKWTEKNKRKILKEALTEQSLKEQPKAGSGGVGGDVPQFAAKSEKHFEYVPIEEVDAYKEFDRETDKKFDKKELDDLTDDIRKNGIKKPIQIKVDRNGKALIVEGNTRLAAAKRLGIKNIPVEIIEGEFGSINRGKAKSLPDVGRSELQRRQQTELGLKDNNGAYSKGFTRVEQSLKETPKAETPTPTDKVGEQPTQPQVSTVREGDWSRDVESTANALNNIDYIQEDIPDADIRLGVINSLLKKAKTDLLDPEADKSWDKNHYQFNLQLLSSLIAEKKEYENIKKENANRDFTEMQGIPPKDENGKFIKNGKEYSDYIDRAILPNLNKNIDNFKNYISEAYHKSKSDGSNPELVKAVEDLLGKPTQEPQPQPTKAKELADKVRKLKIDLGKLSGGGLQSNPLGLPVAVWNGAMDIIAKTIETGGNIADAIKRGLNYIQKNHRGQWNKKQFNDEVMKELGVRGITVNGEDLVVKDVDKEFAETINGFYSDLEQTILEVSPTDKGTPQAWLKKIGTGDEAKWTGVTDWLNSLPKDQKLTRKEILDWLKDNRIQVVEVVKGNTKEKIDLSKVEFEDVEEGSELYGDFDYVSKDGNYRVAKYRDGSMILFDNNDVSISKIDTLTDIVDFENEANNTKFSQYQLEGQKENYKEVLITLPEKKTNAQKNITDFFERMKAKYGEGFVGKLTKEEEAERLRLKSNLENQPKNPPFKSSHWDEPSILVHLRMNTRTDAEGKKVLFLEEVQSDWGQKGKKEGFDSEKNDYKAIADRFAKGLGFTQGSEADVKLALKRIKQKSNIWEREYAAFKEAGFSDAEINKMAADYTDGLTPSAPFVTDTNSWTKLGLKVALKEAVKQGADKIAWTTGEQQNDRYDLSKQVDEIRYFKSTNPKSGFDYSIDGTKNGQKVFAKDVKESELEGIVGKDVAKRIIADEGTPIQWGKENPMNKIKEEGKGVLRGEGLKVGGKGMKGFYGSPSEGKLGIVGEVAKSLFKQEPKTIKIMDKETPSIFNRYNEKKNELAEKEKRINELYDEINNSKVDLPKQAREYNLLVDEAQDLRKEIKDIERTSPNALKQATSTSTQHSIDITPELKQEAETGLPLFKDIKGRGKEIADLLRKGKIKMGGLQSNIAGIPIAIYNAAIETIALALEGGATLTQAIQKAINKHKLNQQKGFNQKEFISKLEDATGEKFTDDQQHPPPPQTPKQEPKEVGIKHKETEAIRQRYGLPEYERAEGKTNAELEAEADELIEKGYNIEKLIKKIEDGNPPTGVENYILTKYIATLEAEIAKTKSDEKIKELLRVLNATDKIGSLQSEAFRTRKAMQASDDSLASFFIKEMDSLGVDELTEEQKVKIEAEFNEIKETNDALQKKIVELEAKVAEAQAAAAISNQARRVAKGRKTKQQFQEERKKIVGNIREKLRKAKGDTQATVVPYLKELILISPDVAQLVKNLVEEGVTNLADVVDNIHDYLKDEIDGIQKKDVIDLIAGVYEPKKPTKGQLLAQWRDLKEEAKLLNKYEALMAGEVPQKESKKIERNRQITELRKKIKESDVTKLANRKAQIRANIQKIEEQISKGDFSKPEKKKPIKLDKEGLQLRDKLIKLKQQRDARILLNQRLSETKNQRALRLFTEVLNIPRTLMTIGDFSGLLRQGIFGIAHPSIMANASKQMFKAAFSQKEYDRWFSDLKEDPRYYAMKESKLSISDSLSHDLSEREEVFMSTLAEKIPIVGQTLRVGGKKVVPGLNIVKGSERSYTALLNKMRVDLFNYFADRMEARGLTVENAPKQYKAMAEYINNSTGRSDFGKHLNRIAPILNATFFSPRLIASRVNMLTYFMQPRFWRTLPKEVRIDYFRSWASLLSLGLVVLGLAKAGGADVEDDPRSSDFGKIKDGDTRWDIWGGAQPYVRVFAQVVSGQRKSTNSGELYELTGDDAFGETRAGVVSNFFRGKLAPVPASLVDVLSGRTTTGDKIVYEFEADGVKEVAIDNYIAERLLPMTVTGTREAIQERGLSALLSVGIPSTFGVGTQTYGKPIKEVRDEVDYEGRKVKLTTQQYKEYRDLANKYIDYYVGKLKSLKEFNEISDRDEKFGLERTVKNAAVKKAESEIIEKYEKTFPQKTEQEERSEEEKQQRKSVIIEKTIE